MDHLLLEEISDERAISSAKETGLVAALSSLRTRRGLDRGIALGLFRDPRVVEQAFHQTEHPVTRALPFIQIEDTMLDSSVRKALAQASLAARVTSCFSKQCEANIGEMHKL